MNIIVRLIFKFLSWINQYITKKDRIVLYSNLGFRDNIKAYYDFLINNNIDKSIICISNDFYDLKKEKNIRYIGPVLGIYYFMTSKYFYYCFGKYPIDPFNQVVINLWHGSPLKKIGRLEDCNRNKKYNYFTILNYASPFFKDSMEKAFGATDSQMMLAGNPRNDYLYKYNSDLCKEKNILWMPTYNNIDTSLLSMFIDSMDELYKWLLDNDVKLYVKLHPLQEDELVENLNSSFFEYIQLIDDEYLSHNDIELYELIGNISILVTDYSSVMFDYLLTEKPIIYLINNIKKYNQDRGLIYNFEDITAGPVVDNFSDLLDYCFLFLNGNDPYQELRMIQNNKFNYYKKNFSQRIYNLTINN